MRALTVILSLMIFIASCNIGSAMNSINEAFGVSWSSSCHAQNQDDSEESSCTDDHEDKNDCCQDNCPCTCCIHIVFYKSFIQQVAYSDSFSNVSHTWKFNYFKDYNHAVFHPPLV